MKYNVGDRVVVKSNLTMLFNPFWKKEKRAGLIRTVTEADETAFTIYDDRGRHETTLQNAFSCGVNQCMAYSQKNGYNYVSRERLLHLEHDREEIRSIMEKTGRESLEKSLDTHRNAIANHQCWLEQEQSTYDEDLQINCELLGMTAHA